MKKILVLVSIIFTLLLGVTKISAETRIKFNLTPQPSSSLPTTAGDKTLSLPFTGEVATCLLVGLGLVLIAVAVIIYKKNKI